MTSINFSSYSIPQLVDPAVLFQMLGIKSTDEKFERSVTLAQIEEFIGDDPINPEDEDSLTIFDAFKLYFGAIIPEYSADHEINSCVGVVNRYKSKTGEIITSFRANGIYADKNKDTGETIAYFEHGNAEVAYRSDLVFVSPNWQIPGTKFLGQAFLTEENKGLGDIVSKVSYLSCTAQDEEENIHTIKIWINCGLSDKDERKKDKGNSKANKLLSAAFHKKVGDFSTCLLPRLSSGSGYKTELSKMLDGYFRSSPFKGCVFEVVDFKREVFTKKTTNEDFPIYSVRLNTELLPAGLTLGYPDMSKPLAKGHETSYIDSRSIGWVQMAGAKFSPKWKQIEAGALSMPTAENPWLLHVTGRPKNEGGFPPVAIWCDSNPAKVDPSVLELKEATSSIALWGGKPIEFILEAAVEADEFDASQVADFEEDEDEIEF